MQRISLLSAAVVAGLIAGSTTIVAAQETPATEPALVAPDERDADSDWGWIGLLGLLGLAGLAGRRRKDGIVAGTRPVDRPGTTTPRI